MSHLTNPVFWILSLHLLWTLSLWNSVMTLTQALDNRPPIALINRDAWISHLPGEAGTKDFEALHHELESLLQPLREEGYLVIDERFVVLAPDHLHLEP